MTRGGVVYSLKDSPYVHHHCGLALHFSSKPHLMKFVERFPKRLENVIERMDRYFGVQGDFRLIALIDLYIDVETRGFHIVCQDGRVASCPAEVTLDGLRANRAN